ncbi:hypothetical protein E2562_021565 [Oryza meyeriana var. granulata]|uniref:Uncharacterized protein n=1 Tax=Oryza meyeriana var. granulata TaxID=110450 RepID=A0A6G1EXV9_9ORYZ|nr:hypothetical protein E2562_021565 [Oryza meyeriana var. granulata]
MQIMNLLHKALNSKKGPAARSSNRTNSDGANSRSIPPRTKSACDGSDSHRSMPPTTNSESVPANGAISRADVEMQGNRHEQEYLDGFIEWAGEEAWPLLYCHWSGDQFLQKRKKAQESRLKCENDAWNRGGSRPYTETQQWLEYNYGPEKATGVNTFAVMKSGAKNIDSSGSSVPMLFEKIGEEPPPDEDLMSPLHVQNANKCSSSQASC